MRLFGPINSRPHGWDQFVIVVECYLVFVGHGPHAISHSGGVSAVYLPCRCIYFSRMQTVWVVSACLGSRDDEFARYSCGSEHMSTNDLGIGPVTTCDCL